tara:strand:- start:1714 stop:2817 length:1104 start_codon:yes stop_codon:yes gene_type:complete
MQQIAIITGITGQDGSYLAEDLLRDGVHVFGGIRRSASSPYNLQRITHLVEHPNLKLIHFDMMDACSIEKFVKAVYDHVHTVLHLGNYIEVYHLAAQSHVGDSFRIPTVTHQVNALGVIALLESLRTHFQNNFRFYQASTSELFGNIDTNGKVPKAITEKTPFNPESPYAIAKMAAYLTVQTYRKAYDIHAVNGILFNHESPRRGLDFVTRKITNYVAQYALNRVPKNRPLQLGNLKARRDWGDAREYVKAMRKMLVEAEGDNITDYVVATGEVYSVRTFVQLAFQKIGVMINWVGSGVREKGKNDANGKDILIEVNKDLFRPVDVLYLMGDSTKIKKSLNWEATVPLKHLISDMVENDIELLKKGS